MSTATSATELMSSMDQAEKDLALYAAIIGCRPTVEPAKRETAPHETAPAEESVQSERANVDEAHGDHPIAEHGDEHVSDEDAHHPHRLSIWMRHVSHEAKRRIHEARMRLAS